MSLQLLIRISNVFLIKYAPLEAQKEVKKIGIS